MKIAVVGGGIFGITAAIELVRNSYEVDLYEKNPDILSGASGINQYRLHRGYHYPRSKATALSSRYSEDSFREEYPEAILDSGEHYYAIAKEGSKVSGKDFINFCKECDLEYKEVDLAGYLNKDLIEVVIQGKEMLLDPVKLHELATKKLKEANVTVFLDRMFMPEQVDEYDFIINAAYANSNFILEKYPAIRRQYQFELCEKPIVKLPDKFKNKSIVIMDGPFFCIDPYSTTDFHVMGNVVHAIHATNTGFFPVIPDAYKPLLDRGVIKEPQLTHIDKFFEMAVTFMPDLKDAEHIGSMFTIRTVLPNVDATDERPTLVSKVNDKIIHVFSGKLGNCVEAAHEVVRIIKASPVR